LTQICKTPVSTKKVGPPQVGAHEKGPAGKSVTEIPLAQDCPFNLVKVPFHPAPVCKPIRKICPYHVGKGTEGKGKPFPYRGAGKNCRADLDIERWLGGGPALKNAN